MSNKCGESFTSEDCDIIPESPAQSKKKFKCDIKWRNEEDLSEDAHVREELQFLKTAGLFSNADFCSDPDIAVNEEYAPSVPKLDSSSIDISEELKFLKSVDFSSTLACSASKSCGGNVVSSRVHGSTSSSSCTSDLSLVAGPSVPRFSSFQNVASSHRGPSASRAAASRNVAFPPPVRPSTSYPSRTENVLGSSLNHRMRFINGVWHFEDDCPSFFCSILPTDEPSFDKMCIRKGGYNLPPQNHTLKVSNSKMSFIFHNHKDFLNYTETRLPKHNNIKMVGTFCYSFERCFLKEYNPSPKVNEDVFVIMNFNYPPAVPNVGDCIEAYGFVELEPFGRKQIPILSVLFWKPVNCWSQKEYLRLLEIQKLFVPSDYKEEVVVNIGSTLGDTYADTLNDVTQLFNGTLKV